MSSTRKRLKQQLSRKHDIVSHIQKAVNEGQVAIVRAYCENKNNDIEAKDQLQNTLLAQAIISNQPEIVSLLLEFKADLTLAGKCLKLNVHIKNSKTNVTIKVRHMSGLLYAIACGFIPLIKVLIPYYNVAQSEIIFEAYSCLFHNSHKSLQRNIIELSELFISKFKRHTLEFLIKAYDYSIQSHHVSGEPEKQFWSDIINKLWTRISAINSQEIDAQDIMMSFIVIGDLTNRTFLDLSAVIKSLVAQFYEAVDENRFNVLQGILVASSITAKTFPIVKLLVKNGVKIETPDYAMVYFVPGRLSHLLSYNTPLITVILNIKGEQALPIIQFLLEHGANPNAKTRYVEQRIPLEGSNPLSQDLPKGKFVALQSALTCAVIHRRRDIVRLIFKKSSVAVDVNALDNRGRTALSYAAENDDVETCKLLLEHDADIDLIDHNGMLPIDHAFKPQQKNFGKAYQFLLKAARQHSATIEEKEEVVKPHTINLSASTVQKPADFKVIEVEYHLLRKWCAIKNNLLPEASIMVAQFMVLRNAICQVMGEMLHKVWNLHDRGTTLIPTQLTIIRNVLFHPQGARFSVATSNQKIHKRWVRNMQQAANCILAYIDGECSSADPKAWACERSIMLRELLLNPIPKLTQEMRDEQIDIVIRELSAYNKIRVYILNSTRSDNWPLPLTDILQLLDRATLYTYNRLRASVTEEILRNYRNNSNYKEMQAAIRSPDLWKSRHPDSKVSKFNEPATLLIPSSFFSQPRYIAELFPRSDVRISLNR